MPSAHNNETTEVVHALKQPLNALRLTVANLQHRFKNESADVDRAHVVKKLAAMDLQIERMADLIDTLMVAGGNRTR